MSYRHTGKRSATRKARKSQECIYCPLKKPIAWPFVFLLFAFSPLIFSSPHFQKPTTAQIESPTPVISQLLPQEVESATLKLQPHLPRTTTSEK